MKRQQSCTPNTGNGGNYYNAYAAFAERKLNSLYDAINSICPKRWTTIKDKNGITYEQLENIYFSVLSAEQKVISIQSIPLSFVFSGQFDGGSIIRRGGYGIYWTASFSSRNYPFYLRYAKIGGKNYTFDIHYNTNVDGLALRCVAR